MDERLTEARVAHLLEVAKKLDPPSNMAIVDIVRDWRRLRGLIVQDVECIEVLRLVCVQLLKAHLYVGYEGGPAAEPATAMLLRQAETLLSESTATADEAEAIGKERESFEVRAGENDSVGDGVKTVTLPPGTYTFEQLQREVDRIMTEMRSQPQLRWKTAGASIAVDLGFKGGEEDRHGHE